MIPNNHKEMVVEVHKSYFKLRDQRIVYLGQVQIDFFEDKEFPVFWKFGIFMSNSNS